MPDLIIPYNLQNKPVTFTLYDQNTGGVYDLTNLTITLKIATTDYVTTKLSKTITSAVPTTGVCTWTPVAADWASFTNDPLSFYGQIVLTALNTQIATFEFNVKVLRVLT